MREKKKVLFVVYRTEWWGCLDSYCRQECEADDTVCYVMPVPRYEREDVTFKVNFNKVHFNPESLVPELPEGACMVNWKDFSLEQGFERIYIHNPYDNNSLTDTVELKYYSANLKPYAKKLIYVSHFMELIPEDFFNCHVYDYVDAIYVPNEKGRFSLDVKYDRKVEVIPPGLPAYLDRLSERKKNGQQTDAQDADLRMKLLYCVSYSDLYYGTEKQLQKMRDIFEAVKRNPDVQLIFRPDEDIWARRHTLEEKIWKGYEQLVADFKRSRTGICDESPDMYKAAVEADGIMSRNHPMNVLFSVQGKYVLQVDFAQRQAASLSRDERCTPVIWDVSVTERDENTELLFAPNGTRLICRMMLPGASDLVCENRRTGSRTAKMPSKKKGKNHLSGPKVDIVAEVPDEIVGGLNYMFVSRQGNCLYLIPYASDGIWKYDMDRQYFSKTYLPDAVPGPVSAVFTYNRYLYMAPSAYPGILRYDTETEDIAVIDGWVREMAGLVTEEHEEKPYFFWAAVQEGHMLYMASSKGDIWMEFDMEEETWQLRSMNLPGKRFVHLVKDGDWVWLLPEEGDEIILWNCVSGEKHVVYSLENQNRERGVAPYLFSIDLGDSVAAFPQCETDHILLISKETVREAVRREAHSPGASGDTFKAGPLLGESEVRKLTSGIPCSPQDCPSEHRRKAGCGYEIVKCLESGRILAYEYYEGSFLLLDRELNLLRRFPCRMPIEAVRQQQDVIWKNEQTKCGYSGRMFESGSIPFMLEKFVRRGREDREKVREYYRDYYMFESRGTGKI